MCQAEAGHCFFFRESFVCRLTCLWTLSPPPIHISSGFILTFCLDQAIVFLLFVQHWQNNRFAWRHRNQQSTWKWRSNVHMLDSCCLVQWWHRCDIEWFAGKSAMFHMSKFSLWSGSVWTLFFWLRQVTRRSHISCFRFLPSCNPILSADHSNGLAPWPGRCSAGCSDVEGPVKVYRTDRAKSCEEMTMQREFDSYATRFWGRGCNGLEKEEQTPAKEA